MPRRLRLNDIKREFQSFVTSRAENPLIFLFTVLFREHLRIIFHVVFFFICKRSMFVEYPVTNRLVTLRRRSDYAYGHSRRAQPVIDIFVMLSLSSACVGDMFYDVFKNRQF